MTTEQLIYPEDRSAERLDCFLVESFPEVSRSQLKKLISTAQVLVDTSPAKASLKLKGGERIEINFPDPEPIEAVPEAIPLTILYEDSHLIVVDKAPGMVVHPAAGHAQGTKGVDFQRELGGRQICLAGRGILRRQQTRTRSGHRCPAPRSRPGAARPGCGG